MQNRELAVLLVAFGAVASAQVQPQVQDLSQLVGKRVIVQRVPLCEPATYTPVLTYAGKEATVLSIKRSRLPVLSQATLARLTPEARAMMQDQQKAATVLLQFEDGKKLDTCAPVGPSRIPDYFELAPGETLSPTPPETANAALAPPSVTTPQTPTIDRLTDEEVKSAMAGNGKDHWIPIADRGLMAAGGATGTVPHISLFMPEAVISIANERAKKQFLQYEPTEGERERSLMVVAQGYIGKTYQEGCESITRVVLVSSPSGGVVEEAYSSEPGTEAWANAFGATNYCQWLRTKFSLAAVKRVQAAAKDGEFYVAVFAGSVNTKTYKIKHKHQSKLGLN